jgi:hypothetical protein
MELRIDRVPVEMVRLKLHICIEAVNRFAERVQIAQRRPDRGLWIGLQQGADGLGHDPHGFERWIQAMLIEPLQVAPGPPAVLRWCRPFPTRTCWILMPCGPGQQRFETDVALPVRTKVIHIPEALAAMEAQVVQPDIVSRGATAAVFPAVDMETMQMLIAPGKQDLQDGMELRQSRLAAHQYPAPDEWTDAAQDDMELVDTKQCGSGCHALRVAQDLVPLKGSPRYLALSYETRQVYFQQLRKHLLNVFVHGLEE